MARGYRRVSMSRVTVVGSVNLDLVATAPRLPVPGETVTDATFSTHPGGKGANQALAARRLGAEVRFIGCVGSDSEATQATRLLREAGVDMTGCRAVDGHATGVALIVVGPDGENQIVVAPGANRALSPEDVVLTAEETVICQLEIPVETVATAVRQAGFSILNCAPARDLPDAVLADCDVVVVNQSERDFYGSRLERVPLVVQTLGAAGAVAMKGGVELVRVPSLAVKSVDAVGAGDAFVGALAVELAAGSDISDALRIATATGALATTRRGAQSAMPTRDEVMEALERT
jgi:ribokinase